jgi:heme exporter protein D
MWWKSWSDFWAMGGAAYFVWMSYGALAAGLVVEGLMLRARHRRALEAVEEERDLEAEN